MFRHDINFLRAFAVLAVMLFHFRIRGFEGGFIGVDVFFVISGFLMTKIIVTGLEGNRFSYASFIAMRIARIWPAFVVLVVALLVLGAAFLAPLDYRHLSEQARAALLFVSNLHYLAASGYFTTQVDERWLLQTWSLSVEWQFYVCFPLVLIAADRLARIRGPKPGSPTKRAASYAMLALFAASLATAVVVVRTHADAAFFSLQTRAWEMLAGGLVFTAGPMMQRFGVASRRAAQWTGIAGIAATLWLAGRLDWAQAWPGWPALLPVASTSLMLLAGDDARLQARWMQNAVVQKIGLWSYSIYLWHWPVVVFFNFLDIDVADRRYAKLAGLAASLALGAVSYRFVETRFRHDPLRPVLQRNVVAPVFAALVAVALSVGIVLSDGWIQRVRTDREAFAAYQRIAGEVLYPAECDNYQKKKADLQVCRIHPERPGKRTLVYGDSHAQHLYPWFVRHATNGVDFMTGSGCPPAPGTNRRDPGFRCDEYVEAALQRARDPVYSTIVVAGNWADGMDRVPGALCLVTNGGCGRFDPPAARSDLVAANVRAWNGLLALRKRIVVVDQSPTAPFDVLTMSMRRRFLGLEPITHFDDVRFPADGRPSYLDDVMAQMPVSASLQRVSLRSEFCAGVRCRTMETDTGLPILLDRSHFVPEWIERHGSALERHADPD